MTRQFADRTDSPASPLPGSQTMADLPAFLVERHRALVRDLEGLVPPDTSPPELVHRAMRYTLLGPSKRVRGVLALLSASACGGGEGAALPAASSIEMVHASSLILDDLPSMDDSHDRRGQPANHVEFGEATSILAAVGLLDLAFATIATRYDAALAHALTPLLAWAVGSDGLIGGQARDLAARGRRLDENSIERIHRQKTAALFVAAAEAGGRVAGADVRQVGALREYAEAIGIAFQLVDDLLDLDGDAGDRARAATMRDRALQLRDQGIAVLEPFGSQADDLRALAAFVVERSS